MTGLEYFRAKNEVVGISMSDSSITNFFAMNEVFPEDEMSRDSGDEMYLNLVMSLLLKPDIAEGDLSIKYDRKSIIKWINYEAKRLGKPVISELDDTVRDMSSLA